jgi:hypothetical protein
VSTTSLGLTERADLKVTSVGETIETALTLPVIIERFERASKKPLVGKGVISRLFARPNYEFFTPHDGPLTTPTEIQPDFSVGCQYRGAFETANTVQMHVWDLGDRRRIEFVSNDSNQRIVDRYLTEFR